MKKKYGYKSVYLIEPEQKPYDDIKDSRIEKPMYLPAITCIAELHYYQTISNPERHSTCMYLVWYQDDFAFPIGESVVTKIKELDWKKLSEEYSF